MDWFDDYSCNYCGDESCQGECMTKGDSGEFQDHEIPMENSLYGLSINSRKA